MTRTTRKSPQAAAAPAPITATRLIDAGVTLIRLHRGTKCIGSVFKIEREGGWRYRENIIGAIGSAPIYSTAADAARARWGDEHASAVERAQPQKERVAS